MLRTCWSAAQLHAHCSSPHEPGLWLAQILVRHNQPRAHGGVPIHCVFTRVTRGAGMQAILMVDAPAGLRPTVYETQIHMPTLCKGTAQGLRRAQRRIDQQNKVAPAGRTSWPPAAASQCRLRLRPGLRSLLPSPTRPVAPANCCRSISSTMQDAPSPDISVPHHVSGYKCHTTLLNTLVPRTPHTHSGRKPPDAAYTSLCWLCHELTATRTSIHASQAMNYNGLVHSWAALGSTTRGTAAFAALLSEDEAAGNQLLL